ncbi:MAG: glycoside hydrolase family 5 protein [Eubacterium sp.]|nr:glycoside hydrolase family 5 protein [Eubacterium sp.]
MLPPVPRRLPTRSMARVKGVNLTDSHGKTVQLKGVSTHGIAWYPQYVNRAAFKTLRDGWGANCVRLAMYTQEYGGYTSGGDKAQLEAVLDRGVKAASSLGMYVIIDWHILSDGNPNSHRKAAKAFFTKMAKRYRGNGHVLYEICNEPNGCTILKCTSGSCPFSVSCPTTKRARRFHLRIFLHFQNV